MRRFGLSVLCAMALGACADGGTYRVSSSIAAPELIYVNPGVYAVADYDEPVFYADNFYWRYDNGRWFRSHRHDRDWVYYDRPPASVMSIDRPYAYRHYRPERRAERQRVVRPDQRYNPQIFDQRPQAQPYQDADRVRDPWRRDDNARRRPGPQPIPERDRNDGRDERDMRDQNRDDRVRDQPRDDRNGPRARDRDDRRDKADDRRRDKDDDRRRDKDDDARDRDR